MNPNRQPAGIPAGGQFAPGFHPESTLALGGDEPGLTPEQSLGDVSNVREGSRTPWGTADWVSHVAPGAVQVSTAGHGGIKDGAGTGPNVSQAQAATITSRAGTAIWARRATARRTSGGMVSPPSRVVGVTGR